MRRIAYYFFFVLLRSNVPLASRIGGRGVGHPLGGAIVALVKLDAPMKAENFPTTCMKNGRIFIFIFRGRNKRRKVPLSVLSSLFGGRKRMLVSIFLVDRFLFCVFVCEIRCLLSDLT